MPDPFYYQSFHSTGFYGSKGVIFDVKWQNCTRLMTINFSGFNCGYLFRNFLTINLNILFPIVWRNLVAYGFKIEMTACVKNSFLTLRG